MKSPISGLEAILARVVTQAFGIFMLTWQFLIPLLLFVVVYWKILGIIRRQAKIATDETQRNEVTNEVANEVGSGGSGGRNRSKTFSRAQINVVETMVYVTASGPMIVKWAGSRDLK